MSLISICSSEFVRFSSTSSYVYLLFKKYFVDIFNNVNYIFIILILKVDDEELQDEPLQIRLVQVQS